MKLEKIQSISRDRLIVLLLPEIFNGFFKDNFEKTVTQLKEMLYVICHSNL